MLVVTGCPHFLLETFNISAVIFHNLKIFFLLTQHSFYPLRTNQKQALERDHLMVSTSCYYVTYYPQTKAFNILPSIVYAITFIMC